MKTVSQFAPLGHLLGKLYYRQLSVHSDLSDLRQILFAESQLILILNHGPMAGPAPAMMGLQELLNRHGGGNRRVLSVTWRYFYKMPILKHAISWVTQTDRALSVKELVARLADGEINDILIMPEGENCIFGDGETVQPFLSPRFIEISLLAGVPILIATHRGTRFWSRYLPDASRQVAQLQWLPERIRNLAASAHGMTLPRLRSTVLPDYPWHFELYRPALDLSEFESMSPVHRQAVLTEQAEQVRARMQVNLEGLPDPLH